MKKIKKNYYYEEIEKELALHKKIRPYLFLIILAIFLILYEVLLNANQ